MDSNLFQKNYLQILDRCGDRMKLDQVKDLMSKVTEEVESMLLDAAQTRSLDVDEIEFLKSARLIDKLKIQRITSRNKVERPNSNRVRFSPYGLITDSPHHTVVDKDNGKGPNAKDANDLNDPKVTVGLLPITSITPITPITMIEDNSLMNQSGNLMINTDTSKKDEPSTEYMTEKFVQLKIY